MTLDDYLVLKGFRILVGNLGACSLACLLKLGNNGKYYDQIEFKKNIFIFRDCILEVYKEFL
jgi:hypothetical protein